MEARKEAERLMNSVVEFRHTGFEFESIYDKSYYCEGCGEQHFVLMLDVVQPTTTHIPVDKFEDDESLNTIIETYMVGDFKPCIFTHDGVGSFVQIVSYTTEIDCESGEEASEIIREFKNLI